MRWQADDPEMRRTGTDDSDLPLFGPHASTGNARRLAEEAKDRTEAAHGELVSRLVPIAQRLAERGEITMTDVRREAYRLGILTGHETKGQMSALGVVAKRAGLIPTGEYRQSDLDSTHARPQRVWRKAS